jgi:hypothetical protein
VVFIRDTQHPTGHLSKEMDSTTQPYPYPKLQGKNEIRLLRLKPGTENDPIRCEIHHVASPQNAKDIALSNTWGNPNETTAIQLNGREHQVTRNLASFLKHMQVIVYIVTE